MDATSAARLRVIPLIVGTLFGCSACAGVETESECASPSETIAPSPSSAHGELPEAVRAALDDALVSVMDQYQAPGAAVTVTTPEASWSVEHGVADLQSEEPVVSDMVWQLRSITKSVVVTVVLQLVDEGQLSLDDTIDTYVDGVPNGEEITLRQLAYMKSGVGDYVHSETFLETLTADPSQQFTLEELNAYGLAEDPQFEPGSDHVYSNTSTNLLGVVIEEVTDQSIAEVIDERIVAELDLTDTRYIEAEDDWADPHAQGYQPAEGRIEPIFNNFSSMGASGAMVSTTDDMTVWAEALATGELISPELHDQRLVGAPLSEGPEYDEYALGIGSLDGWWGHTGEGLGFTALVTYDVESETSVVIFMNISDAVVSSEGGEEVYRHVPTALRREYAEILDAKQHGSFGPYVH